MVMKPLLLLTLTTLALANPHGYYQQEYQYQQSASAYQNNELQHQNEDKGYYYKEGDIKGRAKPYVKAHSEHSEYVNPKVRADSYYDSFGPKQSTYGQLNAQSNDYYLNQNLAGMGQEHYGSHPQLQQIAQMLQDELSRELQLAILNQRERFQMYGTTDYAQVQNDLRHLETELRRNITMRMQEALRAHYGPQGIRGSYSYSIVNGRLQPTANYHYKELEDITRQLENTLMRQLEEAIRNQYQYTYTTPNLRNHQFRQNFTNYSRPYNYIPPSSPVYVPEPVQIVPHPAPDSVTTIATRVQNNLNERLNRILEDVNRRHLQSNVRIDKFFLDRLLAQIQQELRQNITVQLETEFRRNLGYNFRVEDLENYRRQIESNLITKLNRDFHKQIERYLESEGKSYYTNSIYEQKPMNYPNYGPNNLDMVNVRRQLQEQLQRQLQYALMQHQYQAFNQYTYEDLLHQLTEELNRNLTRQIESTISQYGGYGGVYDVPFANLRNQLQDELQRELRRGLQEHYSSYSTWSAHSSASSNFRPVRAYIPPISFNAPVNCLGAPPGRYKRSPHYSHHRHRQVQQVEDVGQEIDDSDLLQGQEVDESDLVQQTENLNQELEEAGRQNDNSRRAYSGNSDQSQDFNWNSHRHHHTLLASSRNYNSGYGTANTHNTQSVNPGYSSFHYDRWNPNRGHLGSSESPNLYRGRSTTTTTTTIEPNVDDEDLIQQVEDSNQKIGNIDIRNGDSESSNEGNTGNSRNFGWSSQRQHHSLLASSRNFNSGYGRTGTQNSEIGSPVYSGSHYTRWNQNGNDQLGAFAPSNSDLSQQSRLTGGRYRGTLLSVPTSTTKSTSTTTTTTTSKPDDSDDPDLIQQVQQVEDDIFGNQQAVSLHNSDLDLTQKAETINHDVSETEITSQSPQYYWSHSRVHYITRKPITRVIPIVQEQHEPEHPKPQDSFLHSWSHQQRKPTTSTTERIQEFGPSEVSDFTQQQVEDEDLQDLNLNQHSENTNQESGQSYLHRQQLNGHSYGTGTILSGQRQNTDHISAGNLVQQQEQIDDSDFQNLNILSSSTTIKPQNSFLHKWNNERQRQNTNAHSNWNAYQESGVTSATSGSRRVIYDKVNSEELGQQIDDSDLTQQTEEESFSGLNQQSGSLHNYEPEFKPLNPRPQIKPQQNVLLSYEPGLNKPNDLRPLPKPQSENQQQIDVGQEIDDSDLTQQIENEDLNMALFSQQPAFEPTLTNNKPSSTQRNIPGSSRMKPQSSTTTAVRPSQNQQQINDLDLVQQLEDTDLQQLEQVSGSLTQQQTDQSQLNQLRERITALSKPTNQLQNGPSESSHQSDLTQQVEILEGQELDDLNKGQQFDNSDSVYISTTSSTQKPSLMVTLPSINQNTLETVQRQNDLLIEAIRRRKLERERQSQQAGVQEPEQPPQEVQEPSFTRQEGLSHGSYHYGYDQQTNPHLVSTNVVRRPSKPDVEKPIIQYNSDYGVYVPAPPPGSYSRYTTEETREPEPIIPGQQGVKGGRNLNYARQRTIEEETHSVEPLAKVQQANEVQLVQEGVPPEVIIEEEPTTPSPKWWQKIGSKIKSGVQTVKYKIGL